MRVSQKQSYKSTTTIKKKNHSNFYIMDTTLGWLYVKNVTEIQRNKPNYMELVSQGKTTKKLSCDILINYLTNFPLFSSKHLDFLD
jgi:hypothetical protein